jgi:phosphatidylinositol phospholipase C delta
MRSAECANAALIVLSVRRPAGFEYIYIPLTYRDDDDDKETRGRSMGVCASLLESTRSSRRTAFDLGRAPLNPEFNWREAVFGDEGCVDKNGRMRADAVKKWAMETQGMTAMEAEALVRERGGGEESSAWCSAEKILRAVVLGSDNFPAAASSVDEAGMDEEMSKYFINSSHNTYLIGDQLFSSATSEAIANALNCGCRVIELDVYDGKNGPIVTHGGTAVRPMLFKDAIQCINDNGHNASEYPVIVTLENHASKETRAVMANIMRSIFKEKLWAPASDADRTSWPSPAALKGRIIIRDKIKHKQDSKQPSRWSLSKSTRKKDVAVKRSVKKEKLVTYNSTAVALNVGSVIEPSNVGDSSEDEEGSEEDGADVKDLVSVRNLKFEGFEEAKKMDSRFSCSWSENKVRKHLEKESEKTLIEFTSKHLLRTYPGGQRIMSNNYDPSSAWSVGASLVALNFQAEDRYVWVNAAKFAVNGGSGYVRKPDYLLDPSVPRPTAVKTLRVHIYAGVGWDNFKDADMYSSPDSLIKISVFGCTSDRLATGAGSGKSKRTSIYSKARTGPHAQPLWNESFDIEIREPELSVLQFTAMDRDGSRDEFLAHYDVAVSSIRQGVRVLPMLSRDNAYIADQHSCAGVLCRFTWLDGSVAKSAA